MRQGDLGRGSGPVPVWLLALAIRASHEIVDYKRQGYKKIPYSSLIVSWRQPRTSQIQATPIASLCLCQRLQVPACCAAKTFNA